MHTEDKLFPMELLQNGRFLQVSIDEADKFANRFFKYCDKDCDDIVGNSDKRQILSELFREMRINRKVTPDDLRAFNEVYGNSGIESLTLENFKQKSRQLFVNTNGDGAMDFEKKYPELGLEVRTSSELRQKLISLSEQRFGKKFTDSQLKFAESVFKRVDTNNSGNIDRNEASKLMKHLNRLVGLDEEDLTEADNQRVVELFFESSMYSFGIEDFQTFFLKCLLGS